MNDIEEKLVYAILEMVPSSKWLMRCLSAVRGANRKVCVACLMGYLAIPQHYVQKFEDNPPLSTCDFEFMFFMISYGMTSPGAAISNAKNDSKFQFALDTYIDGGIEKSIQYCAMSKVMLAKTFAHWVFSLPVAIDIRKSLTAPPGKLPMSKKRKIEDAGDAQSTIHFKADPNSWKDRMHQVIDKGERATTVALAQFTGGSGEELTGLMQRWINIGLLKSKNQYGAFFAGTNVYGGDVFEKQEQESFSATMQRLWCIANSTTQHQFPIVLGQLILMGGNIGDRLATGDRLV